MRGPGQLNQRAAPVGQAFAEEFVGEIVLLQDVAGGQIEKAEGGSAVQARAFVEMAVDVDESLGEGVGIMGIGAHDLICVGGSGDLGGCNWQ